MEGLEQIIQRMRGIQKELNQQWDMEVRRNLCLEFELLYHEFLDHFRRS